jgi:SAM-dependent methyltransferase
MSKKSPQEYLADYQKLHTGEVAYVIKGKEYRSDKLFDGSNFVDKLLPRFMMVLENDFRDRAPRVLDYGCGKAEHMYKETRLAAPLLEYLHPSHHLQTYWCYDPGFARYAQKPPKQSFDIVICADVMEHVPEEAVQKTLEEIGSMISGKGYILFTISCRPAVKHFADGENLHCTVREPDWWKERIKRLTRKNIYVVFEKLNGEEEAWELTA